MIKLAASEARNNTVFATSSGSPILCRAVAPAKKSFASAGTAPSKPGVKIGPGLTMFTRIFLPANSFAAIWAILFNAPLVAEYTLAPEFAAVATVDEAKRNALYTKADQQVIDDAVVLPIYYDVDFRLVQPNVRNCWQNAMEFRDMSEVYFVPMKAEKKK